MKRILLLFALTFAVTAVLPAATLPAGFQETPLATGLSSPTSMTIAPDGRIFVTLQAGALRVIKNGSLLPEPFLVLSVSAVGERGLLGVAFDPDFATNQYVYVYYTTSTSPIHNRVSRFTADGDVAVSGSETILLEMDNLTAGNHNGGAIHFGPDGKLYIATGENAVASNAQSLENLLGKILRIDKDGSIPSDNPFYATATGNNRAIWALGLRNPFTFAFRRTTGTMFINDVGAGTWEEINVGARGANYGWPATEGPTNNPDYVSPLYAYNHSTTGVCAISGGAFYNPSIRRFPADYDGDYFFADYCAGWIRRIDSTSGALIGDFATGISYPVDIDVANDGSLYYLARGTGSVMHVTPTEVRGDVNGDGATGIDDVFYLVNFLFGDGAAPVGSGDSNGDGSTNASDVFYLVSYLFASGPAPQN